MSLKRLQKLLELKHISEFTFEKLITDFSLYESAIIDLRPVDLSNEDEPRIEVSNDVKQVQQFLLNKNPLMLPCPECQREMPFNPKKWGNPQEMEKVITLGTTKNQGPIKLPTNLNGYQEKDHNVFEITDPVFLLADERLVSLNDNDLEFIKDPETKRKFIYKCIIEIKKYFFNCATEIRRDYTCSFNATHRLFVNFRIYDPIEPEDIKEYAKLLNDGESDLTRVYEELQDCLIIQKVGQYPSLADMQMFDVEQYRSVLGKDSYRDLTRAIGLNADGIGAGAFLYLRRIIERLTEESHQKAMKKDNWNEQTEEEYKRNHFGDKLKILEDKGYDIIPEELVEVKPRIYAVLSKGVHENTDEECKELFPYMQFIIEQILDKRIQEKNFNKRLEKLKKKLT